MQQKIFISCSSKDRKIATAICNAVEARGQKCWMSSRDVLPGENFQGAIVRAIRNAGVMVFVFSANANNSDEIKKEIALAGQNRLMVIPVRVEDVVPSEDFSYELATRQWVDLFEDWEHAIEQLIRQINHIIPPQMAEVVSPAPPTTPAAVDSLSNGDAQRLDKEEPLPEPVPSAAAPPRPDVDADLIKKPPPRSFARGWRHGRAAAIVALACLVALGAAAYLSRPLWFGSHVKAPVVAASAGNQIVAPFTVDEPPYPYHAPDRAAAVALLDSAKVALAKFPFNDKYFGALAESRENLMRGYSDISETDEAQQQAHILIGMTRNATAGDWVRNGTKIYKLATAAKVLLDAGNAQDARAPILEARKIWDASIVAPDPARDEWIYAMPMIGAYVALHDMGSATQIYDWLEQTMEHGKGLSWSGGDAIVRMVLKLQIDQPLVFLVQKGQADAAFTLAQTLRDPDARISALATVSSILARNKACSMAPKVAPALRQAIASRGNDIDSLFSLASDASWCGLKGFTQSTIQTILATKPDQGFVELAADAARVGDADLANKLLARRSQNLSDATDSCLSISRSSSMGEFIGKIPLYIALADSDQATHAADVALGAIKGFSEQPARLSCTALVAETLADAGLWDKAGSVALLTYQSAQGYSFEKNPRVAARVVTILGMNGHFEQAKAVIGAIKDTDSADTARVGLAISAAQWGKRQEANMLLSAIGAGKSSYYKTAAGMARVYAGFPAND